MILADDRWRVWVDTGGTFTDCLARDPAGGLRRVKVLSTSALRGVVEARLSATELVVGEEWGAPPGLVAGFSFGLLGAPHPRVEVLGYDPAERLLRLARPYGGAVAAGAAFEVASPEEAPVLAARLVTGTPAGVPLPPLEMRLATTRGTNALLERRGVPVAFFVTRGFGDLLRIGTQQRPDLFALDVRRPAPIHACVVEVPERLAADGSEVLPCDLESLRPRVEALLRDGVAVAAVVLLHSYRDPRHEREVEGFLRAAGFRHVSRSSALAPLIKVVPRAETAVVDAYLTPVIRDYLDRVEEVVEAGSEKRKVKSEKGAGDDFSLFALPFSPAEGWQGGGTLHVMTSAGGLVRPEDFRAKDSLLSGPAGGVVGAARAGRRSGHARVIAFDMGGTSTDVARYDGDFEYVWEHQVADAHLVAPALAIESVAAGGGSVCAYDENGLRVGPESAGASPGPACYGAGGPLTVTDVNLLLGRLDPRHFGIPVSPGPASAALDALRARIGDAAAGREALLEGLLDIANERMADAIRGISLRRGYDPAEYALVAFGGAGGQHACGVADRLGVRTVVVPPDAGLLSALGIGHAVLERFAERQVLLPLEEAGPRLPAWLDGLAESAVAAVEREGVAPGEVVVRRRIANLRYAGQESTLAVEVEVEVAEGVGGLRERFEARFREVYGHRPERRAVEVESLRVIASSRAAAEAAAPEPAPRGAVPAGAARSWWRAPGGTGEWREVPVYERAALPAGARFAGPALVWEAHGATVVEPGWAGRVDGAGAIVLERARGAECEVRSEKDPPPPPRERGTAGEGVARSAAGEGPPDARRPTADGAVEAVAEELFTSRFAALVGEMGEMLRRTALSTNVKERLDFSCALLDPGGELVVNAPHIPVHLGALGLCVRAVREALPLRPGDVAVTNHPAYGGSHLPDVTAITPVHSDAGELLGYLASRAHHAEIGGTRPGSMPPAARTLAEEGVVIPPTYLVEQGRERWDDLRRLLAGGPYPSRAVDDNLADLRAQVAANHRGAALLRSLARAEGRERVLHYMGALTARAERRVRQALAKLPAGRHEALERLDDGSPIHVAVEIRGDSAVVDFAGSSGVHPGNLNATPAIVRSAVLYVLRLLVDEPLPLNEGLMRAVEVRLPPGLLAPDFPADPARAPAVVGGNTEVSQRVVDTLLRALGLAACSQGTMNNVLWGNERFGYYETVCGGCGAGPGWHGASAVHSHMTNTRITDPEVVEHRYPVRVERFAVRAGSGGAGRWRGGDGVVRELTFLEPMSLSVLTQHRVEHPYGVAGGEPGQPGRQRVIRADGTVVDLGPVDGCEVAPGDRLVFETPGGGGWGAPGH